MIDVDRLRWTLNGRDVTCVNCHTAIVNPTGRAPMCPACLYNLGQDLTEIHAQQADERAVMRSMEMTVK